MRKNIETGDIMEAFAMS